MVAGSHGDASPNTRWNPWPAPAGKDAADLSSARAIMINNVEAIVHTDEQYEEINLALRLAK